jgi:hypothetical protein
MHSKVRMIAAAAVAFALVSGAAQALPPSHHPQPLAPQSTVKGNDGTFIDPNGLVVVLTNILKSLLPPSSPQTSSAHPVS